MELIPELQLALAGVLGMASKIIFDWWKESKKGKSAKAILGASEIYNILNEVSNYINCDRILLLKTSNGGGIPTPGGALNISILYEVVRGEGLEPIRDDWQTVMADEGYIDVLSEVVKNGKWVGSPEDLKEDSLLRALYTQEDIKKAKIYEVARTEKDYYYLSVRWRKESYDSILPYDIIHKELVIASNKIKNIILRSS